MQENGQIDLALLQRSVEEWNARRRAAEYGARLPDLAGAVLIKAWLPGALLRNLTLRRADLSGANLAGAALAGANAEGAALSGANLTGADLVEASLAGADLTGASLPKAVAVGACLAGARLAGANATAANFERAELRGADCRGADLSWARLYNADLTGADLTGADLTGADLNGAVLEGANLDRAILRNTRLFMTHTLEGFEHSRIRTSTWAGLHQEQLYNALKGAETVEGAQFDDEFSRWRLPSLRRIIARTEAKRRAADELRWGGFWTGYRILVRPRTGTDTPHRGLYRAWQSIDEKGRPCPLGMVGDPPGHTLGALIAEGCPREAKAYRMTLPTGGLPVQVRDALTDLIRRYGRRPGGPTPKVAFREATDAPRPSVTVTVDAPSLDHILGQLRTIRRAIFLPADNVSPGISSP